MGQPQTVESVMDGLHVFLTLLLRVRHTKNAGPIAEWRQTSFGARSEWELVWRSSRTRNAQTIRFGLTRIRIVVCAAVLSTNLSEILVRRMCEDICIHILSIRWVVWMGAICSDVSML